MRPFDLWPGEEWEPLPQYPPTPEVDWGRRHDVIGGLWLVLDGEEQWIEYANTPPAFGFGRYLEEMLEEELEEE